MKTAPRIILSLLLCAVLCLCFGSAALAEDTIVDSGTCGENGDNLTWTLKESGELVISGTGDMAGYGGGVPPWYDNRLSITSVLVEDGVTGISSRAFIVCSNLKSVSIPESVTYTGDQTFLGCSSLESVSIPGGVASIGNGTFEGCSSLTSMSIPHGVSSIGSEAFFNCTELAYVVIPDSVRSIASSAFQICDALTAVYYTGTQEQWNAISITYNGNEPLLNAHIFYNGEIPTPNRITFDPNGGSGTMDKQLFFPGDSVMLRKNSYEKAQSVFTGWQDQDGNLYADKATISPTEDLVLTAQWAVGFTITFVPNGGTGTMDPMAVEAGHSMMLNVNTYQRENHEFLSWLDQNGKSYSDRGVLTPTEDLVLTAQWKRTSYSIRFDGNGASGSISTKTVSVNSSSQLPGSYSYTPPDGKMFAGWNTEADGSGTFYYQNDYIRPSDDMTLYAQWTNPRTVSFYPNGGGGTFQTQTIPEGIGTALNTVGGLGYTAPSGLVFANWNTEPDGSGSDYADGEVVTVGEDLSLYAQWAEPIIVTFKNTGNSGYGYMEERIVGKGRAFPAPACEFYSNNAYEFKYWTKTPEDPGEAGEVYPEGAVLTLYEDTTLYAQWRKTQITGGVSLSGSITGINGRVVWGEKLTANSGDGYFVTDLVYTWTLDGEEIQSGPDNTYTVRQEDFGKEIVCTVAHPEANNQVSSNARRVGTYTNDSPRIIVNNGDKNDANARTVSIWGVLPEMIYTRDGEVLTTPANLDDGVLEITMPGIYDFGGDTYEISSWYRIGWTNGYPSDGSGSVSIKNFDADLPTNWMFPDWTDTIVFEGFGNTWLVKEGADTDITVTMTPSSGAYVYYSLNGGEELNANAETTVSLSPITGPVTLDIRFSSTAPSVPVAPIDEEHFPDPAFRRYVQSTFDRDGDGILTDTEIDRVSSISCASYGISSLKGIELFDKLTVLYCQSNSLTELNLSDFPNMTTLYCSDNALTALDLSACPKLTMLYCQGNALASLQINGLEALTNLDCSGNLLTALDLSGNPALRTLTCYDNLIGSLNLSANPELTTLNCYSNFLTELDLRENSALTTVYCQANLLTRLDLSGCGRLRTLYCESNNLTQLVIESCVSLATLSCQQNALSELDLSACTQLRRLTCSGNSLTALKLRDYSLLTALSCQNNALSSLEVSGCAALKTLTCQMNALTELDLSGCTALLTLIDSVEPVTRGDVVTYGNPYSNNAVFSFDRGVLLRDIIPAPDFILPSALTAIGEEAFVGNAFVYVRLPEQAVSIGRHAFADCPYLAYIYIPETATEIDPEAFGDTQRLTILGVPGTAAEAYAQEHDFTFVAVS